jgi:cytochrome c556
MVKFISHKRDRKLPEISVTFVPLMTSNDFPLHWSTGMKKLVLAISLLSFAASTAFADTVLDRQEYMKERGKLVKQMGQMAKGETDFDAAAVLTALKGLEANAEKFDAEAMFPEGSLEGDTTASPKIWEDFSGFKAAEEKYLDAVEGAVAAPPGDLDALKATMGTIGGECGACHKAYRIKKS